MLQGARIVAGHRHRIVPGREALVAVGILRRIQDRDHVPENLQGGRLIGGEQLKGGLHHRFEAGRLVPVDGVGEERHRGNPPGDFGGLRHGRLPGIRQAVEIGPDLVEPGQVFRRRDDQHPHHLALGRRPDDLGAHPLRRRRDQPVEGPLLLMVHRVPGPQRMPQKGVDPGHRGPVGTPAVPVEGSLGGGGGHQGERGQQRENGTHKAGE
jgi:hypothetical protein